MALQAMRVPTVFTAVDRFSDVVSRMTGNVSAFGQTAQAAAMRTSRRMNSLGTDMLYGGAAMAVGFGYAINEATKYEEVVANLAAVTRTKVGSMNDSIESLAKETKRSVIDITKGYTEIGSKMSEYLQNPTALREIAKQSILLADASKMSVEDSTDNLTSILNQFKLSYTDANRVVNKLSAGEDIGASTIPESADMVRQFAASARMAGASLEETIALVQSTTKTLGKQGVGRGFRNLMVDLNTGQGMDKNKKRALLMVGADLNKIINPTTKFIDKLREVRKLLSDKQAMGMFFKKTGFETGATFLESFKLFEQYLDFTIKSNTAQEKADKNNATLAKGWKDTMAMVQLLAIKIGSKLLPKLNSFIDIVIPIIEKTTQWVENNEKLIKAVFYLTVGVIAMGIALKVGAFYMLGYSRALLIVEAATEAYAFVNMVLSFGLRGVAIVALEAAASLYAILWPLAALGLAVWVVIDMVQHWEDWHDIIALCIGPLGWVYLLLDKILKHSNNISNSFAFEGWSGGIKAIGTMLEDLILSPLIGALKIMGRLTSFIPGVGSSFTEMANDLDATRTKIPSEVGIGNLGMQGAANFQTFGGVMPSWDTSSKENVAGQGGISEEIIAAMQKQVVELIVKDPGNNLDSAKVNGQNYFGMGATTGSTTGKF